MRTFHTFLGLLVAVSLSSCTRAPVAPAQVVSFSPILNRDPDTPETWYRGRMDFYSLSDPLLQEAYGPEAPTIDSILGDGRREILCKPDAIRIYSVRHRMPEDYEMLERLTLLGFSIAIGNGVPLDKDTVRPLVLAMQQLENYGDNFLGVTSADFGLKFTKGTNTLDLIFELVVPSITLASRTYQHDDRRALSPTLMAEACKLAEAYLFEDQYLQRKIEIFRSNK